MPTGNPRSASTASADRTEPCLPIGWQTAGLGRGILFSPAWTVLTGQTAAQSDGRGWMACIHPDDRGPIREGWRRARTSRLFTADLRVLMEQTGAYRWFRTQALPVEGEPGRWSGTAIDIADLHDRLVGESELRAALHHRIRNTLAVIRSIARRTAENSETVEDYRIHFDGRLAAFARTQSHIMRNGRHGVDLEALFADELLLNRVGGQVTYSGPEIRLPPRIADQLGIALHELTANAVQFGALSREDGSLDVRWWMAGHPPAATLHIEWREILPDGGVTPPEAEGFGLELLTRGLHYEVDAEVALDFTDQGMTCSIALPFDPSR